MAAEAAGVVVASMTAPPSSSADPDWRTRHCAEPVVDAIVAATGRDIWAELGGCPRTWREAAALYRRVGVRSLACVVTSVLGPPVDRKRARRGDIVMVRGALGICRGDLVECFGATVPIAQAERAWRL